MSITTERTPGSSPLRVRRVGDILDRPTEEDPDRPAVVASNGTLSYQQLDAAVERAAGVLWESGIRAGQVVAVSLPNALEIVVAFHSLMRLGAVFLGVNQALAPPEQLYQVRDADAALWLTDPAAAEAAASARVPIIAVGDDGRSLWRDEEGRASPADYRRAACDIDDPAGIAYTSGTTGRPKGVVHSQRNLLLASASLVADRGYSSDLRRGDCAALTILNLQVTSTLLAATAGGTQVVMNRVDPVGIAEWIRHERINSWFGVPTMLHGLATSPDVSPQDLETLDDVWTGGATLLSPVRRAFETRFGRRVHATYGMTEVPTVVTIEPRGSIAPDSDGQTLGHLSVDIRNPDGSVLPAGKTGEITVRARRDGAWEGLYRPMLEYLGHPEATAKTVRDGVLWTGDIGFVDPGGNLQVRGRRQSVILRGGANVYPAEVERVLLEIPGVAGCAVLGLPDDRLGERIAAIVETEPGHELSAADVDAYCRANLARYKIPVEWRFAKLPRNAMGKVIQPAVRGLFP